MRILLLMLLAAVPASARTVLLSWTASTTLGVTYNVYRAYGACPATGLPFQPTLIHQGIPGTAWPDKNAPHRPLCYYVTAVDANFNESVPSNMASLFKYWWLQ